MRADLFISTHPFDFDQLEEIFGGLGRVYRKSRELQPNPLMPELQIETDIGMFYFDEYDPASEDFYNVLAGDSGPEELAKVKALGEKPYFMLLSYEDWQLADYVFLRFPIRGPTLVENEEDGMIRPIEEVRRNIQARGSGELTFDSESGGENGR